VARCCSSRKNTNAGVFWRHEICPDRLKEGDLPLTEFAACAGFSAQSQFSYYFNRLVGVTPGRFRMRAKIAKKEQVPPRNGSASALTIPHE
jgi:AraC-like DNA-binding protein